MTIKKEQLQRQLINQRHAYTQLQQGTKTLLAANRLYWTERLLLKLAHQIASLRLRQLAGIMPDDH